MAKMRVHTDRLRKGMVIKNDVYSIGGLLLVNKETPVTKEVLELLRKHFIDYVIADYEQTLSNRPIQSSIEEPPVIKPTEQQKAEFVESIQVAEKTLSDSLKAIVYQDDDIDVPVLLDMVNDILEKASNDVSLCDMLFCMKESKESLYKHSINVSLLGQILAKWLGFTEEEIELVSITGLLHDIGILEFQNEEPDCHFFMELWENKKRRYEKHVLNGYNKVKNKNIDLRVKQAILTHHERIDQSGFPLQIGLENINKISRVIAIADTYDILTMQEAESESMSPLNVLKYLQDLSYSKLDPNMLMTFIDRITHSYIQQEVVLNNGKIGKIIIINKFNLARPLIETDSGFVDLATHPELHIVKFAD